MHVGPSRSMYAPCGGWRSRSRNSNSNNAGGGTTTSGELSGEGQQQRRRHRSRHRSSSSSSVVVGNYASGNSSISSIGGGAGDEVVEDGDDDEGVEEVHVHRVQDKQRELFLFTLPANTTAASGGASAATTAANNNNNNSNAASTYIDDADEAERAAASSGFASSYNSSSSMPTSVSPTRGHNNNNGGGGGGGNHRRYGSGGGGGGATLTDQQQQQSQSQSPRGDASAAPVPLDLSRCTRLNEYVPTANNDVLALTVYPLRVRYRGLLHHFLFQNAATRASWRQTLEVRMTCTRSQAHLQRLAAAPQDVRAFVRRRLSFPVVPAAFEYVSVLGAGTFGRVLLARHRLTGRHFALKVIRKTGFHGLRNVVEARRERKILDAVDSPYIMRLHTAFQTDSRVYLLLDYLPGGELLMHTQRAPHHRFDEASARFFIAELAVAVHHLQQHGMVHRDVKGDNLVLDAGGHVVLTDFGFAKKITLRRRGEGKDNNNGDGNNKDDDDDSSSSSSSSCDDDDDCDDDGDAYDDGDDGGDDSGDGSDCCRFRSDGSGSDGGGGSNDDDDSRSYCSGSSDSSSSNGSSCYSSSSDSSSGGGGGGDAAEDDMARAARKRSPVRRPDGDAATTCMVVAQRTSCGTLAYMAPEILHSSRKVRGYGFEVDWWSLGVVLFTILTGYFPFLRAEQSETSNAIVHSPLQFPQRVNLSPAAQDLLLRLVEKNPTLRIATLEQLKQHVFFTGFDWRACEHGALRPPLLLHKDMYKKVTPLVQATSRLRACLQLLDKAAAAAASPSTSADAHDSVGDVCNDAATTTTSAAAEGTGNEGGSGGGSGYTREFAEEVKELRLIEAAYGRDVTPSPSHAVHDVFGALYSKQEDCGSDRGDNDDAVAGTAGETSYIPHVSMTQLRQSRRLRQRQQAAHQARHHRKQQAQAQAQAQMLLAAPTSMRGGSVSASLTLASGADTCMQLPVHGSVSVSHPRLLPTNAAQEAALPAGGVATGRVSRSPSWTRANGNHDAAATRSVAPTDRVHYLGASGGRLTDDNRSSCCGSDGDEADNDDDSDDSDDSLDVVADDYDEGLYASMDEVRHVCAVEASLVDASVFYRPAYEQHS